MGQNQGRRACFMEFSRWQHQSDIQQRLFGRVCEMASLRHSCCLQLQARIRVNPNPSWWCIVEVCCCQGLRYLEHEIASLGGLCAAALMKKDLVIPATGELSCTGELSLTGELLVTGELSFTAKLSLTGELSITGELSVAGELSFTGEVWLSFSHQCRVAVFSTRQIEMCWK